jgi:hypothetical protein
MEDTRKGFLTPEQEQKIDDLKEFSNRFAESLDGPAIRLADNQGLERLKPIINEKWPDVLPYIYEIVDGIMAALPETKKE